MHPKLPMFRVGMATSPQAEDPAFVNEAEAIEYAQEQTKIPGKLYGFNIPVAIWDQLDNPVWLFILGEQFRRV